MSRVILLNGGGMDSLVTLAFLLEEHAPEDVISLHYWYGQKAYPKEVEACIDMAKWYKVIAKEAQTVELRGSSITNGTPTDYDLPHYVPQRNLILIACAAAFGQSIGVSVVAGGWQSGDTDCPDVQASWLDWVQDVVRQGGYPEFQLRTPLGPFTKDSVITTGDSLGVPWDLAWSCFYGDRLPCGVCLGCSRRRSAFLKYIDADTPEKLAELKVYETRPMGEEICLQ